ncbi:MAG: undecaprenyl-diphosphate phosphatase [Oscillospiraceae bacterium]|nr:undecaprenyl-diphosphate phosphatase [Oscillospiraceae bacterium]
MNFWHAILLGVVQGIAEFLPISSSGHLAVLQNLFQISAPGENDLFFDILLHIGTLFAVLLAYRKDISAFIREAPAVLRKKTNEKTQKSASLSLRLLLLLIIAAAPLVLVLFFKRFVEQLYYDTFFISAAFAVTGLILFLSDRYAAGEKDLKETSVTDALVIGFAQTLAVVPGLSRSGATISAGLCCGLSRPFAVKFSFLLSIPAILGALLASIPDAIAAQQQLSLLPLYLSGMLTSAVLGYFSIRLIDKISKTGTFGGFAYYCWGAGLLTFFLSLIA